MTEHATPAQEALRLALIDTMQRHSNLTPQETLAVLSATCGQMLAVHVREASDKRAPMRLVLENIDVGRRSIKP